MRSIVPQTEGTVKRLHMTNPGGARPLYRSEESTRVEKHVCDLLYSISDNSPRLARHRAHSRYPHAPRHNWERFHIALKIERRAPFGLLRCMMEFWSCRFRTAQLRTIAPVREGCDRFAHDSSQKLGSTRGHLKSVTRDTI